MYSDIHWKEVWEEIDCVLEEEKSVRGIEVINIFAIRIEGVMNVVIKVRDKGVEKSLSTRKKDFKMLLENSDKWDDIFDLDVTFKIEEEKDADEKITAVSEFFGKSYYDVKNSISHAMD